MTFETKMKKRIDNKLNAMVKNPYQKEVVKHPFPLWAKISLPLSCLATSAIVAFMVFAPKAREVEAPYSGDLNAVVAPVKKAASTVNDNNMSATTYNSYKAFTSKFASLMMHVNNTNEKSMAVSIPDAYLCLAITGVISSTEAMNDILSYLELNSLSELKTACREVIKSLCSLYEDEHGLVSGGYNLNSIWLNPDMVKELENKDAELYQDLKDVFDAAVFLNGLNDSTFDEYIKEYGPSGFKNPKPNLGKRSAAFTVLSGYYCLDSFNDSAKEFLKEQCESGNHKINYTFNNSTKAVNYYQTKIDTRLYEGANFYGAEFPINHLYMAYFLPNEGNMPSAIMDDVLSDNYSVKQGTYYNHTSDLHSVTFSAPYFSIDNDLELDYDVLKTIFPVITKSGAAARICEDIHGGDMFLNFVKQFSTMTFDYNGFYSASFTAAGGPYSPPDQYAPFEMKLDRPHVFEVTKYVRVGGVQSQSLPIVVGEVVDPNFDK